MIGEPLKRKEDRRFVTGAGGFTDDLLLPRQAYAAAVRSPHAHARVRRVDAAAAQARPGVLLVLTAADVEKEIVNPIPSFSRIPPFDIHGPDGAMLPDAAQYPLARDTVRYAGEPVALVVADTPAAARDAAEHVAVDYEPLGAVVDIERALASGAPTVWDDAPTNVSFRWERGDARAIDAAFDRAAHVVRVELVNNRVAPMFLLRGRRQAVDAPRPFLRRRAVPDAGCRLLTPVPVMPQKQVLPSGGGDASRMCDPRAAHLRARP